MKDDATCDDILYGRLKLWQPLKGPRVNLDTILLSAWVKIRSRRSLFLELGCATGAISMLLALKFGKPFKVIGLEIQDELVELANLNRSMNSFEDRVNFVQGDLRDISIFKPQSFDGIVINPPYESPERGRESNDFSRSLARLELTCTPDDVAEAASRLLKSRGRLFAIFRTARLAIFVNSMLSHNLVPKRLRFIHAKAGAESNVFLIECVKDGGEGLTVYPQLVVFDENGNYTPEALTAYEPDGHI